MIGTTRLFHPADTSDVPGPLIILFNSRDGRPADLRRWRGPTFKVPAGYLAAFLDDPCVRFAIASGEPCVGVFERPAEGHAVAAALEEARRRRMH